MNRILRIVRFYGIQLCMIAPVFRRSLSLSGLSGDARELLSWARRIGAHMVHLDAAASGLRPRELSRTARRDLAASLRRDELAFTGLDLWIPPSHFADTARVGRAIEAIGQAANLAAEIGALTGDSGIVLCTATAAATHVDVLSQMLVLARREGIEIADHSWPIRESNPLPRGIDPAVILATGSSAVGEVARLNCPIASSRLSDFSDVGRVPAGEGTLDVREYEIALASRGYSGPMIVDLRGIARWREQGQVLFGSG